MGGDDVNSSAMEEDLKIENVPDEEGGGVRVNGEWYVSLQRYFEKREEELKQESE